MLKRRPSRVGRRDGQLAHRCLGQMDLPGIRRARPAPAPDRDSASVHCSAKARPNCVVCDHRVARQAAAPVRPRRCARAGAGRRAAVSCRTPADAMRIGCVRRGTSRSRPTYPHDPGWRSSPVCRLRSRRRPRPAPPRHRPRRTAGCGTVAAGASRARAAGRGVQVQGGAQEMAQARPWAPAAWPARRAATGSGACPAIARSTGATKKRTPAATAIGVPGNASTSGPCGKRGRKQRLARAHRHLVEQQLAHRTGAARRARSRSVPSTPRRY